MGRRRRRKFGAKSGAQQPRASIAGVEAVPDAEPERSSSSAERRQKRPNSDCSTQVEKRRRIEYAEVGVADKNKEQEYGESDAPRDGSTSLGAVLSPENSMSDDRSRGAETEEDGSGQGSQQGDNETTILVTCGHNEGRLYLSKLRVVINERCRSKCIRTGNKWWTPNEFQFVSGRGAAKDWKRTVKHSGQCLKTLLTRGTLCFTSIPPKCLCPSCAANTDAEKTSFSPGKQKKQEEERNDDDGNASETQDLPDRRSTSGTAKGRSTDDEVKRSKFRSIKIHRRTKRHTRESASLIADRKRGSNVLPVSKKTQKPELESNSTTSDDKQPYDVKKRLSRQGQKQSGTRRRLQKQRRGRPKKIRVVQPSPSEALETTTSSIEGARDEPDSKFREGNRSPDRKSSSLSLDGALEGCCNSQDETEVVPGDVLQIQDGTNVPDEILRNKLSTCEKPRDDDIADVINSSSKESDTKDSSSKTKDNVCLITEINKSVTPSSPLPVCPYDESLKEPEVQCPTHSVSVSAKRKSTLSIAKPEVNRIDSASGEQNVALRDVGPVKNPSVDDVTVNEIENDVTREAPTDMTAMPSSTVSLTSAPRKSAYLDAVIAELKRKKISREAGIVPAAGSTLSTAAASGGTEEMKVLSPATPSSTKLPSTTATLKSEVNSEFQRSHYKTTSADSRRSMIASGHYPVTSERPESPLIPTDTKPSCLKPTRSVELDQDPSRISADSRTKTGSGLRKTEVDSTERHRKMTTPLWRSQVSALEGDGKETGVWSDGGRKFGVPSGGLDGNASLGGMNSPLNISQLASMYGLSTSPLTSLPFPQPQFPLFPPYLFMGFPLQPLLPQFTSVPSPSASTPSSSSTASGPPHPLVVPPASSAFGSTQHRKQRRTQYSCKNPSPSLSHPKNAKFPQGPPSTADPFAALRNASLLSSYNPSTLTDFHRWRGLVADFATQPWTTGSAHTAGSSKSHSGNARSPIWRPGIASQAVTGREYNKRDFDATIPYRPFAHAPKEQDVTSAAGDGYKKESAVPVDFTKKLRFGEEEVGYDPGAGCSGTGEYCCDDQGVLDLSKK